MSLRVLMLSWRGPGHPRAGGAELYTARVLDGLAARGHTVVWVCEHGARGLPGLRVLPVGRGTGLYLAGAGFLLRHAAAFDVVVDQINGCGFLTPLYSPLPVLALIHQRVAEGWAREPAAWRRRLGPAAEGLLLRPYRQTPFLTVSRTSLLDLRAQGWAGPGAVARNGVDAPAWSRQRGPGGGAPAPPPPKEPGPTLIYLARLQAPGKGLNEALRAYSLVRAALPQARLWVVGRGSPPPALPPGAACFANASDALRDTLLARAWLLLATSVREGWGRMVLEAAAAGTPCAAYAAPGLAEAAAAVGGRLTPPDPNSLAGAAIELLRRPGALRALGTEAARLAGGFSWGAAVATWEVTLEGVAGGPRRRPPPP